MPNSRVAPPKALPRPRPVDMPAEWSELIDSARVHPATSGAPRRAFSETEDYLLLEGRKAGLSWVDICERIGCAEGTARKRLRELARIAGQETH